jgi:CheY-specific phosphatase CheX
MTENTEKIKKTLLNSIFEVFEKMFFVFLERSEQESSEYHWVASIKFYGVKQGELKAYFTDGIVDSMAQNMLNLTSAEITEKLREDCLKEAVNVLCGDFLRNLDSSNVFDLSLPSFKPYLSGSIPDSGNNGKALSVALEADSGVLSVVLTLGQGF